ncbi:nuclear transport factor 2 family protein [Nocardia sp. alder85J]|uniref:nuclear transport factor 2 family protein n=1 Tax=Nocardia sp. alder85J TaxID=2862949 RepID=UPI001CD74E6A|nr:nuclear transport factor 2 family protein [Nocardia sp. alder85J]MCX4094306.1 nuclear transport factor 2 family protein [Nocardia sp. alder85J]
MTSTLGELADRLAVIDTVIAYATAVDARDWESFAALYTADAVWEYRAGGERWVGPAAIVARVRGVEKFDATQHYVTNHVVDVHGDEAGHTCYYEARHLRGDRQFVAGGRYRDRLRRTGSGWRIAERTLLGVWSEGDPSILGDAEG